MIAATLWLASLAAQVVADDPYYVFEIQPEPARGMVRVQLSPSAIRLWALDQLQSVSVFDGKGYPLPCETQRISTLQSVTLKMPLEGHFSDVVAAATGPAATDLTFTNHWIFTLPALGSGASIRRIAFDWTSATSPAGNVELFINGTALRKEWMTGSQASNDQPALGKTALANVPWKGPALAAHGELRFQLRSNDFHADQPVLEIATLRSWSSDKVYGPGWILFEADGLQPYRVQLSGRDGLCTGIGAAQGDIAPDDLEWPPRATMIGPLPDSPKLDRNVLTPQKRLEAGVLKQALFNWAVWLIGIGITFAIAIAIIALSYSGRKSPSSAKPPNSGT